MNASLWYHVNIQVTANPYSGRIPLLKYYSHVGLLQFVRLCENTKIVNERFHYLIYSDRYHMTQYIENGFLIPHLDGLVQERRNCIAKALDLCLSCTNPSIYKLFCHSIILMLSAMSLRGICLSAFIKTPLVQFSGSLRHHSFSTARALWGIVWQVSSMLSNIAACTPKCKLRLRQYFPMLSTT